MSKKHFIALADALKRAQPKESQFDMESKSDSSAWLDAKLQWNRDVRAVADVCLNDNSRFDYHRWMSYIAGECGPNGGKAAGK